MPTISTKEDFIKHLIPYTKTSNNNIAYEFSDGYIKIEETEKDGKGEIFLDISSYTKDIFFIKIEHLPNHNIGIKTNHNDGIVLKIDLNNKKIVAYLFELKKQLRFSNLKKAAIQLVSAYKFIKYLMFEKCFDVEYNFIIGYKVNNINYDVKDLTITNKFETELFSAVSENKKFIPLQIPFCIFQVFNFQQVEFGKTIKI